MRSGQRIHIEYAATCGTFAMELTTIVTGIAGKNGGTEQQR